METRRITSPTIDYGDIYARVDFTYSAEVSINEEDGYVASDITTECEYLLFNVGSTTTEVWHTFSVANSEMSAANMDTLLYCMTTETSIQETGYQGYVFMNWEGLDGTLNPVVLDTLVEKAP